MIASFMQFYHYSLEAVLDMYAISFYALYATSQRLIAGENIESAYSTFAATSGGDVLSEYMQSNQSIQLGARALIDEANVLKKVKGGSK